jgi:hypothetical protein
LLSVPPNIAPKNRARETVYFGERASKTQIRCRRRFNCDQAFERCRLQKLGLARKYTRPTHYATCLGGMASRHPFCMTPCKKRRGRRAGACLGIVRGNESRKGWRAKEAGPAARVVPIRLSLVKIARDGLTPDQRRQSYADGSIAALRKRYLTRLAGNSSGNDGRKSRLDELVPVIENFRDR